MCVIHLLPPAQPLGFVLEGHPLPAYNGAYRKVSEHKGWPVLRNGAGMFCYRYEPKDQWFLRTEHTPDSNLSSSYIASAEGPLPIGAQTWQCDVDVEWGDHSLSVTVLVRHIPPLSFMISLHPMVCHLICLTHLLSIAPAFCV